MAEWWQTFFEGVALDMWRMAVRPEQTRADADRIEKLLELPQRARILDAPCGFGRVALELAQRGYQAAGIDIAPPYVEEAQTRARELGVSAEFHVGDVRDMPWRDAFDGIFCTGNSFAYFEDAGNDRFVRSIARALSPGGKLLLECPMVAESILSRVQMNAWYQIGEIYTLAKREYDALTGRLQVEYTFIVGGKFDRRTASYRIYTCRQIVEMVQAAGLEVIGAWGSADRTPFTLSSGELLLLARKP